jgi:hypothetical protein
MESTENEEKKGERKGGDVETKILKQSMMS